MVKLVYPGLSAKTKKKMEEKQKAEVRPQTVVNHREPQVLIDRKVEQQRVEIEAAKAVIDENIAVMDLYKKIGGIEFTKGKPVEFDPEDCESPAAWKKIKGLIGTTLQEVK